MIDERLIDSIVRELQLSGMPELPLDGPSNGGFAVQPDEGVAYVVWSPSDELSTTALDRLANGETEHPSVLHMGEIQHAMARAILDVLKSAGFNAVMSTDDMAPATVEVRPTRVAE
jgi:hypothetical protein